MFGAREMMKSGLCDNEEGPLCRSVLIAGIVCVFLPIQWVERRCQSRRGVHLCLEWKARCKKECAAVDCIGMQHLLFVHPSTELKAFANENRSTRQRIGKRSLAREHMRI